MERVIICETDRIGDVILTLPVFKSLKKWNKSLYITALVSPYTKEIFKNFKYVDDIIEFYIESKSSFENTLLKVKSGNFDTALVLHPEYKVAKLLKKARIPTRISYGWKWYQFLFTDILIQHRSRIEKHQLEYNLELLKFAGVDTVDTDIKLIPTEESLKFINTLLKKRKLKHKKLIGIHPGSGNSALGLPIKKYAELINILKKNFKKAEIIITHSSNDREIIKELISTVSHKINLMPENLSLSDLIALISKTDIFISNSTGPLHIASALRIPVIGFYSPVFVHSPVRWGPYWGKRLIITPDVKCPEKWRCKKEKCNYYHCFDNIEFNEVVDFVKKII